MSPGHEPRIGDAERDAAITALGEHFAAGRLTKGEYDERSDVALRARTGAELRPLFVDLPPAQAQPTSAPPRAARTPRPPVWQHLPLLPMLALLAVLVAVTSGSWWVLFIVGWMFWCGPRRYRRWH